MRYNIMNENLRFLQFKKYSSVNHQAKKYIIIMKKLKTTRLMIINFEVINS